jgi:hypothetical protein
MDLGSATHTLLMEPHKFQDEFVVIPNCDGRTKEGKSIKASFQDQVDEGKIAVSEDQVAAATAMAAKLAELPIVADLLDVSGGLIEASLQWVDAATGVPCKGRLDYLVADLDPPVILDVKTCRDCRRSPFRYAVKEYGYNVQAAMYSDAVELLTGRKPVFVFACVDNTPPHCAKSYFLGDAQLQAGRDRYRELLATYKVCEETGVWPGYDTDLEELD